jgi:hypothetical protein
MQDEKIASASKGQREGLALEQFLYHVKIHIGLMLKVM